MEKTKRLNASSRRPSHQCNVGGTVLRQERLALRKLAGFERNTAHFHVNTTQTMTTDIPRSFTATPFSSFKSKLSREGK